LHEYGEAYELIALPDVPSKVQGKDKRTHSRERQRKHKVAACAQQEYSTADVLKAARDFLQAQDDGWVNFSMISQHLYERFYKLKPKHLGEPGKKYSSLLKFLMDYPAEFEVRPDRENKGSFWIRLGTA